MTKPTHEQYQNYQAAYDWFNTQLFGGKLTPCLLTFSRKKNMLGFFACDRWARGDNKTHEITLNPDWLHRPLIETFSTLVHEQCHQWQAEHGKPSRGGYHNEQWADMMEAVGLMPSDTGKPGGKRTGQKMTHYILDGGAFKKAFDAMPASVSLPWRTGTPQEGKPKEPKPKSKVKFTCPSCQCNAWGKPGLLIACVECTKIMVAEEGEKDEAA